MGRWRNIIGSDPCPMLPHPIISTRRSGASVTGRFSSFVITLHGNRLSPYTNLLITQARLPQEPCPPSPDRKILSLAPLSAFKRHQKRCCKKDRRVGTGHDPEEKCKRKELCCISTEEKEGNEDQGSGERRIYRECVR